MSGEPADEAEAVSAPDGGALGDPLSRIEEAARRRARALELLAENQGLEGRVADLQRAIERQPELKETPLSGRREDLVAEILPAAAPPKPELERVMVGDDATSTEREKLSGHTTAIVAVPRVGATEEVRREAGRGALVVGIACVLVTASLVAFFAWRAVTPDASPSPWPAASAPVATLPITAASTPPVAESTGVVTPPPPTTSAAPSATQTTGPTPPVSTPVRTARPPTSATHGPVFVMPDEPKK